MPSFGEKLKQERIKRAVTLDQISQSTKIGTRMLQALEEDRFNQLPGGIFNKGFVRAYARCVGLDEDQAVADYLEASGDVAPPKIEPEPQPKVRLIEAQEERPARELPWGWFAAILLLAALALSLWSYRKRQHQEEPRGRSAPTAVQTPETANPSGAATGDQAGPAPVRAASSNSSNSGGGQNPVTAASPSAASGLNPPANPNPPVSRPVSSGPSGQITGKTPQLTGITERTQASPATGQFAVLIEVREDSWVSVSADGKTVLSGMLSAGTRHSIFGRKSIMVRLGNAGGVDLSFNGRRLPSQGDYSEVRNVTFGSEGLVPTPPSELPPALGPQ